MQGVVLPIIIIIIIPGNLALWLCLNLNVGGFLLLACCFYQYPAIHLSCPFEFAVWYQVQVLRGNISCYDRIYSLLSSSLYQCYHLWRGCFWWTSMFLFQDAVHAVQLLWGNLGSRNVSTEITFPWAEGLQAHMYQSMLLWERSVLCEEGGWTRV